MLILPPNGKAFSLVLLVQVGKVNIQIQYQEKYGSWLFLGVILTNIYFKNKKKIYGFCGSCSKCIQVCPTQAIIKPYTLDARKCISYLTIEHKSHIKKKFRKNIGNRIFGCDDCLAVCPWNKFAKKYNDIKLPYQKLDMPSLKLF